MSNINTNQEMQTVSEGVNWKQKLSSRKLWCALAALLVGVLTAVFGEYIPPIAAEIIDKVLTTLWVYIGGESAVDAVRLLSTAIESKPVESFQFHFPEKTDGIDDVADLK